jgi:tetratricopeptide (TPR) repeat protein
MFAHSRYRGVFLAFGVALLAGCGTPSLHPGAVAASVSGSPTQALADSASAEKIAQAHAHYAAGVIFEMNDDADAALEEYYQAALSDPATESLVMDVSRRLLQKKQPEKALELLLRATARPDAGGALFARLGIVYSQLGKPDLALAAENQAIKRAPDSLAGYQASFVTLLQGKRDQEALALLDQAARQTRVDASFLLGLSELYQNFGLQVPGQKDKARAGSLAALNRAAKLGPADPALELRLAEGFSALGASDKAAEIYLDLLKRLPNVPYLRERVHAQLADIYLRKSDRKLASEQLEAITRDDPANPQPYFLLGSIAADERKPAEAAEYFNKTVLLSPNFEQAYYELATAQLDNNKPGDALATLEKARRRFSQGFVLEYLSGAAYSRQKAWTEAIRHYTAAEVIGEAADPKRLSNIFYFQFGAVCERKGDFELAEKYFQKCLQLAPDFDEAQNYLGYMWAEHGIKLTQARELIEKAVKAEPENAAYLDSLGWVLFKLDQPKEALPYVLKAVQLSTEPDPSLYDHLGDIYAALKEPDKAREAWRKSLSLEANETIRKKLEAPADK